jgi:hypothetical protein
VSLRFPSFLRLHRRALARDDGIAALVVHALRPKGDQVARAVGAFAFKNDEQGFARELLARKTEIWLFRSNQHAFCGDFVVVDVSSPSPARRRAFVLDLKHGAKLRPGGGGAGVQLRNASRVVRDVALATGALEAAAPFELLTGDAGLILAFLGARRP